MSGLFSTIRSASSALQTYTSAMGAVQQNLLNASTPGYAKQVATLVDIAFDAQGGQTGGVRYAGTQSTRDTAMEATVQFQTSATGYWKSTSDRLNQVVSYLDAGGSNANLGSSISALFREFQGWANNPTGTAQKVSVLSQAKQVATAFNDIAKGLGELRQSNQSDINGTVEKINQLAEHIASLRPGDGAGEADLYNSLENLSELTGITVNREANGTLSVYLGGQVPIVANGRAMKITAGPAGANGGFAIQSESGADITMAASEGKLGAELKLENETFPGLLGDGTQEGTIHKLARVFGDAVNAAVGTNLFQTTESAARIRVSEGLDETTLEAPSASAFQQLLQLAGGTAGGSELNDQSFTGYYEAIVTGQASSYSAAQGQASAHGTLLEQSVTLRQKISGADTDEEAINLLQLQQAFQATTKIISTVNEMVDTVLAMVR